MIKITPTMTQNFGSTQKVKINQANKEKKEIPVKKSFSEVPSSYGQLLVKKSQIEPDPKNLRQTIKEVAARYRLGDDMVLKPSVFMTELNSLPYHPDYSMDPASLNKLIPVAQKLEKEIFDYNGMIVVPLIENKMKTATPLEKDVLHLIELSVKNDFKSQLPRSESAFDYPMMDFNAVKREKFTNEIYQDIRLTDEMVAYSTPEQKKAFCDIEEAVNYAYEKAKMGEEFKLIAHYYNPNQVVRFSIDSELENMPQVVDKKACKDKSVHVYSPDNDEIVEEPDYTLN